MTNEFAAVFDKQDKQEDTELPVNARKYACTVVSLLPLIINEEKPHMLPSTFRVPAAVYGKIAILHVEEGIHWVPDPILDRSLKQVTSPSEMSRSIVDDYTSAHICLGEDCMPGLFWVEGRLTVAEVEQHHKGKIRKYKTMQDNWFHALCNMADADWHKNHNMMAVSNLQRMAARSLGLAEKYEWVQMESVSTTECPFCKFRIALGSIKCINCKEVVDQAAYNKLVGGTK